MKIVNIIQRYPPAVGGSETWCQEVCRYLVRGGHDVKVLTLDINKEEEFWRDPLDNERTLAMGRLAIDAGVIVRRYKRSLPVHSLYHGIYKTILDDQLKLYFYGPHSIEMYGRMWREIQWADVVFLHTIPYPHNYIAFLLAKIFRKKTVIVPHFHPTHPHYERKSNYWLMRNCDCVITVSDYEKDYLANNGIPYNKMYVTGNAINPEEYQSENLDFFKAEIYKKYTIGNTDKIIIFIGRKTREKGVANLIEAVRELHNDIPIKLFLVGPGIDWYENLYANLSSEDKKYIIDMGIVSHQDKVNLLRISDLLVLPSQYEAFGIVFLEAWICGVPVLGTTEGAMPSIIGDEGFLCKFGETVDLKSKLYEALSNPENLKLKGSNGRQKTLQKYTWDVIGMKAETAIGAAYGK